MPSINKQAVTLVPITLEIWVDEGMGELDKSFISEFIVTEINKFIDSSVLYTKLLEYVNFPEEYTYGIDVRLV